MREVLISGRSASKAAMEPSFGEWASLRAQVSADAIAGGFCVLFRRASFNLRLGFDVQVCTVLDFCKREGGKWTRAKVFVRQLDLR